MSSPSRAPRAALPLLLTAATVFGANHVSARVAMDHGVDVATAVAVRSLGTALVVGLIVHRAGLSWRMPPRARAVVGLIALLVTAQSVLLYSAVARIPVGLALLAFNTYPLWTAAAAAAVYGHRPERRVLLAMPVILAGLALALNAPALVSGGDPAARQLMLLGVTLAVSGAAVFGLVLALTQHEVADVDGRLRTCLVMAVVGSLALGWALAGSGLQGPRDAAGWCGLALLTLFYGVGITFVFTVLPRLGVVSGSPLLNAEPVAALLLAWPVLGQSLAPLQWLGAAVVVAAVMVLGLRPARA